MSEVRLNLGCGRNVDRTYTNVDKDPRVEPDVIADLEEPLPMFEDGYADYIFAANIMEHIHKFPELMDECWRILKPDGILTIAVPVFPCPAVFSDPNHVRVFTQETFNYFLEGTDPDYGYKKWTELSKEIHDTHDGIVMMDIVLGPIK